MINPMNWYQTRCVLVLPCICSCTVPWDWRACPALCAQTEVVRQEMRSFLRFFPRFLKLSSNQPPSVRHRSPLVSYSVQNPR